MIPKDLMYPSEAAKWCGVCGLQNLTDFWDLPSLPLTETFGDFDPTFPSYNQALCMCMDCGHVQLLNRISPSHLYSPEAYQFKSLGVKRGKEEVFFLDFAFGLLRQNPGRVLEFGANDLSLANRLIERADEIHAVDPMVGESTASGLFTHPMFVMDFFKSNELKFDLVMARHTLEHVDDPKSLLASIRERLSPSGIVVLEFPNLESIVKSLRGDAFFHQHYHYFDFSTVSRLSIESGMRIIGVKTNSEGSNGGSLLVALDNGAAAPAIPLTLTEGVSRFSRSHNIDARLQEFKWFRNRFSLQCEIIMESLALNDPVVGVGAGLMTPILNYHLRGEVEKLSFILDDDRTKHGTSFKNMNIKVAHPDLTDLPKDFSTLITSTENLKTLYARSISLGTTKIISLSVS